MELVGKIVKGFCFKTSFQMFLLWSEFCLRIVLLLSLLTLNISCASKEGNYISRRYYYL